MSRKFILSVAALLIVLGGCKDAPPAPALESPFGKESGVIGDSAMVVASRPEAAEAGLSILRKGGNAVDAAVAVHFSLAVTFPYAGNLGGGGFAVYRQADGSAYTLDFREKAPLGASRDMYLDESGEVIPDLSLKGVLAVGVPGSVDGIFRLHERFGKLPWAELLQPAIEQAEQGHLVTEHQAFWLNKRQEDFIELNPAGPYLVQEGGWQIGDTIFQKDLAQTLRMIRDKGRAGFYEGPVAAQLLDEMKRQNGLITQADLDQYEAQWRQPVTTEYKDLRLIAMGPPSSGGVVLAQMLEMVEDYPIADWGFQDRRTVHLMAEAERRAFADRAEFLGDPDFYEVPIKALLAENYTRSRMADFDSSRATPSDNIGHGEPLAESTETTHYSIIDLEGNAISITTTLNSGFGSGVWVQGAGFLLNNEMDDFSAKPGAPNQAGLVGNEANAIAPGKRMLSSMTPTIVEKDGQLFMVVGTPGGSTIITSVFQMILNIRDFGMTMRESVDQPRFHHQWLPDAIQLEKTTFPDSLRQQLEDMGHQLIVREHPIGRVNAILIRPDGTYEGAGDRRRDDVARGF